MKKSFYLDDSRHSGIKNSLSGACIFAKSEIQSLNQPTAPKNPRKSFCVQYLEGCLLYQYPPGCLSYYMY